MGAGWTWNTLADSACSHHIPSLAPAVALPAPRHDRRRTGAAGSPPGGFPFVELTSRGCEICRGCALAPQSCAPQSQAPATNSVHSRPRLREGKLQRESTTSCPGRAKRDPGPRHPICGPGSPLSRRRAEAGGHWIRCRPSLDSGNSLCYRTQPLRGPPRRHSGRIAQLVEQLTLNQRVPGSSPGAPTNPIKDLEPSARNGQRT